MEIAQVCIASWGNNAVLVVLTLVQHSIDIGTVSGNTICSFIHLLNKCLLIFKYFSRHWRCLRNKNPYCHGGHSGEDKYIIKFQIVISGISPVAGKWTDDLAEERVLKTLRWEQVGVLIEQEELDSVSRAKWRRWHVEQRWQWCHPEGQAWSSAKYFTPLMW